ncbi:LuxR C-terminal-related transcriptional regulator [Gordonia sp. NPDC003425]
MAKNDAAEVPGTLRLRTSSPALPPGFVPRPRLDALLSRGESGTLTLVCAGPGYGKTLAVAAWARQPARRGRVAWLTVGEGTDVPAFWLEVITALRTLDLVAADARIAQFMPGPQFGGSDVDRLADALADLPQEIVLVVDDCHRIVDDDVRDSLNAFVDGGMPNLHLVLVGREQPQIPLRRLQLTGRLVEIDSAELAFTQTEAREFCARAGLPIGEAALDLLVERTQGWPAGMRLALLSSPSSDGDPGEALRGFGGQNRLVAAYLLEEILARMSPSDQRFLLATSVAPMIHAELAKVLTGRADSRAVLDDLVARNALTVRLSERPDWFRYHPLFRELLLDRLGAESPESIPDLHRRAADWFLGKGESIPAVRHLVAAGDWRRVAEIVGTSALPLIVTVHAAALAGALVPAVAEATHDPSPEVLLLACVVAHDRRDYDTVRRNSHDAQRQLAARGGDCPVWAQAILANVRLVLARVAGVAELHEASTELMRLAADTPRAELPAAGSYALIGRNNVAISLVLAGDLGLARAQLDEVRVVADRAGMAITSSGADAYLAMLDAIEGKLPDAGRRCAAVIGLVARRGWSRQPQFLAVHAAAALSHLSRADCDAAAEDIRFARPLADAGSDRAAAAVVEIVALGLAAARRDLHAAGLARARLQAMRRHSGGLGDLIDAWSVVASAHVDMLGGDFDAARESLDSVPEAIGFIAALVRIARARIALSTNRPANALQVLGEPARYAEFAVLRVEAGVLSAVAADRLRRDAVALVRIGDAIGTATPIGALLPFTEHGGELRNLLTRVRHLSTDLSVEERSLIDRVMGEISDVVPRAHGTVAAADTPSAHEALTEREMAVLRYLPTMYKAAEIASHLFVSVNTVKTHQQSIYRKLGASSRREAVDRAREHNLL